MESNDRMSEIARDLKKDVKELLFESAAVVTSFFKRGLCTVRAAADKWKTFARNVSTAADELMKPPLIQEMEVPATDLLPTDEPVVTVVESGDLNFPVGMKLSLSAANEYVRQMDALSYDAKSTPHTVRIKIDYTQGETRDRYTFPLQIGSGRGGLLEQMERNLAYYRADPERIMGGLDVSTIDKRSEAFFRSSILPLVQKSVEVSTPFKNVIFRRNGMSFFAGKHTGVYSLNHRFTCRPEARQVLIYQCILDLTGENDKYNYSKAAHLYPPFSYIPCSAKNYKIAPALTSKIFTMICCETVHGILLAE